MAVAPGSTAAAADPETRVSREVAWRVFAAEYNASNLEVKEGGDRSPSYVVTPLGARANRLLVVGVLTVNETMESAERRRAQVLDPTGVFHVYAGQFEPEATAALAEIKPPAIVAVVGKSRAYSPEPNVVYTSLRPESVRVLDVAERDRWILDTARQTLLRIDAIREARKLGTPTAKALEDLGYGKELADGVVRALAHYKDVDLERYAAVVRDAVETLLPRGTAAAARATPEFAPAAKMAPGPAASKAPTPPAAAAKAPPPAPAAPKPDAAALAREEAIHALVAKLDDGKGAPWEEIVAEAAQKKISEEQVEEALMSLMDKGVIYEPVLGRLKRTED